MAPFDPSSILARVARLGVAALAIGFVCLIVLLVLFFIVTGPA